MLFRSGSFNSMRWDRKIEPQKYELAKYKLLEARQSIISVVVDLFFNQIVAQQNLEIAKQNHTATDTLYQISKRRFEIGAIKQAELLQLELRLLNEGIAINENQLQFNLAQARLSSYLGYNENANITLRMPSEVPGMEIGLQHAYDLALNNSSFSYQQRVNRLEAERAVAQTKANRNPQVNLFVRFGLNQIGDDIAQAYTHPLDQQKVSLGFTIPIFDGGEIGRAHV